MKRLSDLSKLSVPSALFYFSFTIWFIWKILASSMVVYWFPESTTSIVRLGCLLMLLLSELFRLTEKHYQIVATIACFSVASLVGYCAGNTEFIDLILFVYCARKENFTTICKVSGFILAFGSLSVVVLSILGAIQDYIWIDEQRSRHGFGFLYCTTLAHYYFAATLCWAFIRRGKSTIIECAAVVIVNYIIFHYTVTRNPFLLSLLVVALVIISRRVDLKFSEVVNRLLAVAPYLLFPVIIIVLSLAYTSSNGVMQILNDMLSNRLLYSHNSLLNYGVSPFGQVLQIGVAHLTAEGVISDWWNYDTNHLDSSFLRILVNYGWVSLVVVCLLFVSLGMRAVKIRDSFLCALLFLNAIHALLDPQLLMLQYDVVLFLLHPSLFDSYSKGLSIGNERSADSSYASVKKFNAQMGD